MSDVHSTGALRQQPEAVDHDRALRKLIRRSREELRLMPKPSNPAELEALSYWYFGKELHMSLLTVSEHKWASASDGSVAYEVKEKYNDYNGSGWLHTEYCIKGYDYSRDFWAFVIGNLTCGGIASHSYGQAIVIGKRNLLRLQEFEKCLRLKGSGRLRRPFERLARKHGAGENTVIRDSRVLISGRVDGAAAASFGGAS